MMKAGYRVHTRIASLITVLALLLSVPVHFDLQTSAEADMAAGSNLLFTDDFETGSIENWEMVSRNISNEAELEYNWANNYTLAITADGFSGSAMSLTRKGTGYVSLDSALFPAEGGKIYSLQYALQIENAVYDTFYGVRAYLKEYDGSGELLKSTLLNTSPRQAFNWTELSHMHITDAQTVYVQVQFWCGGVKDSYFTASFDNVSLIKASDNTNAIWGFELADSKGVFGWTFSHPEAVSGDQTVFRNGNQSLHLSQFSQTKAFTATANIMIPVESNTRYLFNLDILSRYSNVDTEGVRLDLLVYDAEGTLLETVQGIRDDLRAGAEGAWRQLTSGLPATAKAAFVKPKLVVAAGTMDFHVDALTWKKYDENPYIEEFTHVDSDGFAADWQTHIISGTPVFSANGEQVVLNLENSDAGYISNTWKLAREYWNHNIAVTYQIAGETTGWLNIRYYDYTGAEITNEMMEASLAVTDGQWKQVQFNFTVPSATYAVVELGGQGAGTISFDSLQIMEVSEAVRESIDVSHQEFTHEGETEAKFVDINGTKTLCINGQAVPNMTYMLPFYKGYMNVYTDNYLHEAGVCISRVETAVASQYVTQVWTGPGQYNFTEIDRRMKEAIANHPDSYLMIQIYLDVPQWWKDANPDELLVSSEENGEKNNVSFASEKFANDAIAANIAMIEYIKQQPYANRVVGAVLCACSTSEWVWYDMGQYALDYSTASQNAFRKYLKEIYGTDAALQAAWNDGTVTLDTAQVPPLEERMSQDYVSLLTPENNRSTLDYHDFMADVNVKLLKRLASEVTEACDDKWVLGAYYGYVTNTYFYGLSNGTMHIAMEQALEDENLDFFCAPVLYNERYDGESGGYMQMIDSIQAHGKAVMVENDNRLCSYVQLSTNFYIRDAVGPTYTVWDSVSQIQRDFANQLTTQVGQWWFNMWGNFFLNKQFSDLIGDMYREVKINTTRASDYQSDICYIIDEDMFTYLAYNGFYSNYEFTYPLLYSQRQELAKIGATYDMYYMSDLAKGLIPDYKVYMIMAPIEMDETEREAVETYLKNSGKTVIWQYISGASDRNTFSADNMTDAIGMEVEFITDTCAMQAQLGGEHMLLTGAEGKYYGIFSGRQSVSPVAVITDTEATVLGTLADTGEAAFAIKDMGDWTSIYTAVPCIPAQVLRNILEMSDIHTYCDDPDSVIFASDKYVAINCAHGGEKTITLPENHSVYEVYTKTVIATDTNSFTVNMADNSTHLYRLMSPGTHSVYVEAGEGGIAKNSGYHEYAAGSTVYCRFEADMGYQVESVTVDGETVEASGTVYTLTLDNISESHYITVEFTESDQGLQPVTDETFNGDFEDLKTTPWSLTSVTSGSVPDTQNNWTANYTVEIAGAMGVNGGAAISLKKNGTGYAALTSQAVAVEAGKSYRLSYSYRTVSLEGLQDAADFYGIHTALEFLNASGQQVENGWVILNNASLGLGQTVSEGWNSISHDFVVPEDAEAVCVYFCIGGKYYVKANVLFDRVQIGAYPEDAIVNSDFEAVQNKTLGGRSSSVQGPSVWNAMTTDSGGKWNSAGTNTYVNNYIVSTHTEPDGNQVMKLAPVSTTRGYIVAYSHYIPVTEKTSYVLSYLQKIDLGESDLQGAKIKFFYFDKNKQYLAEDWYRSSSEAHDWQQMENTFTTRANTAYVIVGFFMGGKWGQNEGLAYYYDDVKLEKKVYVAQWNLSLGDSIGMNFYIDGGDQEEKTTVTVSVAGEEAFYNLSELPADSGTGLYMVSTKVAAGQMTEMATVTVFVDGEEVSSQSYSVYTYGQYILSNSSNSATKKLVLEMLSYGAAAQEYFDYEAEKMDASVLVGAATEEVSAEAVSPITLAGEAENVRFYGASLVFRSRTAVRFYFEETGNLSGCTFTVNGEELTPGSKDGLWYVEVAEIAPQNLDQTISLTVTDGENTMTVTYSPMHYMVRKSIDGPDALKALLKAMYNYHLAAKAYAAQ